MKTKTKNQILAATACALVAMNISRVSAQGITGGQYLNIVPANASYTGDWNASESSSTSTGFEINAPGGSGSFSTLYYAIPANNVTANNPADTQVVFNFTFNSGTFAGPVNVLFALDDSLGGVDYYGTGYTINGDGSYSKTFALQSANQANVANGAVINGLNLQLDPANVSGNYDITFNSITLQTAAVPEPSTFAFAAFGSAAIWLLRRRK